MLTHRWPYFISSLIFIRTGIVRKNKLRGQKKKKPKWLKELIMVSTTKKQNEVGKFKRIYKKSFRLSKHIEIKIDRFLNFEWFFSSLYHLFTGAGIFQQTAPISHIIPIMMDQVVGVWKFRFEFDAPNAAGCPLLFSFEDSNVFYSFSCF